MELVFVVQFKDSAFAHFHYVAAVVGYVERLCGIIHKISVPPLAFIAIETGDHFVPG